MFSDLKYSFSVCQKKNFSYNPKLIFFTKFNLTMSNSEPNMTPWPRDIMPAPVQCVWLVQLQSSSDLQNSISIFTRDECVLCKYVQVFVQMSNEKNAT